MSVKRKDKKGRNLRNGECQRKNGLYQYEYTDLNGETKCLYSWRLEPTDPLPSGKRQCISLREKEREVQQTLNDSAVPFGRGYTVLDLVKRYVLLKKGVRESTRTGYKTVTNFLEKDPFGSNRIDNVRLSDAKRWLIRLQEEYNKSYSSIHTIRGVLRPAFQMAVDDELIKKNPFSFELATVIVNDSVTREAITHKQKRAFLDFVKNDKHFSRYYDGIYILFFTGMRISEFCGLTVDDIDLPGKTVKIRRQLHRTSDMRYIIEPTKTEAGNRVIPIDDEVCACFKRILESRNIKINPVIPDGLGNLYSGFLWLDKNGMPLVALHWEKYFQHICEKYNKIYKTPMPKVTPHVCRHTYCSHNASAGMNPKHLQYLMGHSDISVTLNTYTHVDFDNVQKEVDKLKNAVI